MRKLRVEGLICLIVVLTYSGLAFYSLVTWQQVSEGLVVGFALFAQSLLRRYFDMPVEKPPAPPAQPEKESKQP